jgi:hypothetical protein
VKRLARELANSAGTVERQEERLLVRLGVASGLAGAVICLRDVAAVQLALPLFANTPPRTALDCFIELLKCEKSAVTQPMGSPLHIS